MTEKSANNKVHRVSISLNDGEFLMLKSLCNKGYLGQNKPTTLAAKILVDHMLYESAKIRERLEASIELMKS
jgi:hypothetical protein